MGRFAHRLGIAIDERRFEGRFGAGYVPGESEAEPQRAGVLLPETFMNRSGSAVAGAVRGLGIEDPSHVLVVYDDADLPFGRLRLRARGSDGGHRGIRDIIEALGTAEVPRLRFGIGRSEQAASTVDYVLDAFVPAEERALAGHVDRAADAVEAVFRSGIVAAMNAFNG